MVEWLTLLLYIREVPDSNFCQENGYLIFFVVFLYLQANPGVAP
jgi:hypothetical protein